MFGGAVGGKRCKAVLGVVTAAVLGVAAPAAQAAVTLTVDDDHVQCPAAAYTTIQSAVDAAGPGDTVNVCRGTYNEEVTVGAGKDGLSLLSSTAVAAAVVKGGFPISVAGAHDVSIQKFRVEPIASGITVEGSGSTTLIRNNLIVGGVTGITVFGDGGTVRDNTLLQQTDVGVRLDPFFSDRHTDVLNNTVTGTGTANSVGVLVVGGGLLLAGRENSVVFGNTISEHPLAGIRADGFGPDPGSLAVKANNVFRNGVGLGINWSAAQVENNKVTGNSGNGIEVSTIDAKFLSNNAKSNGGTDCLDHTTGTGTAGTANTWTGNYGLESSPVGICKP